MLRARIVKCSSFDSMMKNLNKTTNAHTTLKQVGALTKLCLIGEQLWNSNFTMFKQQKMKALFDKKGKHGKGENMRMWRKNAQGTKDESHNKFEKNNSIDF